MKPHRAYLLLSAVALAIFVLAMMAGCRGKGIAGAQAGAALVAADTHNASATVLAREAKANVDEARKQAEAMGKELLTQLLTTASRQLKDLQAILASAKDDTAALRAAVAEKDAALRDRGARLAQYDRDWLGGRGHRLARTIALIAGGLFVAGVILQALGMGVGGLFGRALAFVGRVCASVVPFVSTMIHDFFAVIHRDKAVVAAKSEADQSVLTEVRRLVAGLSLPAPAIHTPGAVEGSGAAVTANL
jgi:hypothetical protein